MRSMSRRAHLLHGNRPVDLSPFHLPGLPEHCQKRPPARSKPVADAYRTAFEAEPQLASPARQVPGVRLAESLGLIGEDVAITSTFA